MQNQSQVTKVWVVQEVSVHGLSEIVKVCSSLEKAQKIVNARDEERETAKRERGEMAAGTIPPYFWQSYRVV